METITWQQFAQILLSSIWPLLILAVALMLSDYIYLIVRRIYYMIKRQVAKLRISNRLHKITRKVEWRIMHDYLIENETESDNLRYWQK